MSYIKRLLAGYIAASKFYHLDYYPLTSKCPHCCEVNRIDPCDDQSNLTDELDKSVGYAKIGVCSHCHNKILIGFPLARMKRETS